MIDEKLKPCPFCGGEVRMHYVDFPDGDAEYVFDCACGRKIFETASKLKAVTAWNTRATHGTLTAEQVREAVMSADRWEKPMGNTGLTNTHLIIRDDGWQAIADELNGLGSGTCEMREESEYVECKVQTFTCSMCGWHGAIDDLFASDTQPNFCPRCGAHNGKAVKR